MRDAPCQPRSPFFLFLHECCRSFTDVVRDLFQTYPPARAQVAHRSNLTQTLTASLSALPGRTGEPPPGGEASRNLNTPTWFVAAVGTAHSRHFVPYLIAGQPRWFAQRSTSRRSRTTRSTRWVARRGHSRGYAVIRVLPAAWRNSAGWRPADGNPATALRHYSGRGVHRSITAAPTSAYRLQQKDFREMPARGGGGGGQKKKNLYQPSATPRAIQCS